MKHFIYKIAIIALVANFSSCNSSEKKGAETVKDNAQTASNLINISLEQFDKSSMELRSLEEKSFPVIVKTNGMIDVPPENKVVINATMGGYIKNTPFLIGDSVKKGQALVTIENPEFVTMQQNYIELNESLVYLKSEYDRQKILFDENISSQKKYLQSESEYKTALARHNGLRKKLSMLNISIANVENGIITTTAPIYAPISGSITKVNITKGMFVSPATSILEIIDNDHIHLELSVFEKDIMKIKKEQQILFVIPEASDETYEAEVYLIGTSIDESRTIKVHGHLKDESNQNILTGMFVDASIITDSSLEQALPTEAIVTINDISYVLLMDSKNETGYTFKQVEIKTGNTYGGYTAVKNVGEFGATSTFLTKGVFDLIGE
ncbi:cobalt-zinc-cadmium efflux system membrane fusion protein [Saonia flava]|uniref:Cobalt-zinc-cadmium efflux system membrane fusion protein n=1 Tax=Saonia flava TaxID=523696 RepID=A0A846QRS4_9FLAO|nr:efflux RND transporter periplasmic adaptor subunit [Saonia flava]NJB71706.1 cobalt-zinc-cadmium efflux system membrane fusion protein [Saonia flava]